MKNEIYFLIYKNFKYPCDKYAKWYPCMIGEQKWKSLDECITFIQKYNKDNGRFRVVAVVEMSSVDLMPLYHKFTVFTYENSIFILGGDTHYSLDVCNGSLV
jgi:hypothetical protein